MGTTSTTELRKDRDNWRNRALKQARMLEVIIMGVPCKYCSGYYKCLLEQRRKDYEYCHKIYYDNIIGD